MKNEILLLAFLLMGVNKVNAQMVKTKETSRSETPNVSIGLTSGINNFAALFGLSLNVRLQDKLHARAGAGIGGWGYKYALGLKYDLKDDNGWSFALGYSHNSGLQGIVLNLETASGRKEDLKMNLNGADNINLSAIRNWFISRKTAFYLEMGYSVALKKNIWTNESAFALSDRSVSVMNLLRPGGIILGLGFNIGI